MSELTAISVSKRPRRLFVLALCMAWLAGCGGVAIVPVEGRVTLDGQPLPDASVSLIPLQLADPGPFFGTTDATGRFVLGTAIDVGRGAAVGEYRLMISTVKMPEGALETTPIPTQKEVVPPDYRSGQKKFTVPAGGTTEANFDLQSESKRSR